MGCDGAIDEAIIGARSVRLLPGHSGAMVYLLSLDNHTWFVRKVATNEYESARLREQARRQQVFLEAKPPVGAPRVIAEGNIEGRFFFDMEYLLGTDGASHLRTGTYGQLEAFTDQLCAYITYAAERSPLSESSGTVLRQAIADKLEQLSRATPEASVLRSFDFSRFDGLSPSLCHGDLTLENIIVGRDGRLRLLDFLPSSLDHTWFDISKLHQDLDGGWYLRRGGPISLCATTYVSKRVIDAGERVSSGYREVHAFLVALAFFRIIPYARTPEDRSFVLQRAQHFAVRAC